MSQRVASAQTGNSLDSRLQESFQTKLHDAVSKGLTEVLGEAGAKATSFHLGLKPSSSAASVHEGLVRLFGTGAQALELSILRVLYSDLGSAFKPEESKTFIGYVSDAKKIRPGKEG